MVVAGISVILRCLDNQKQPRRANAVDARDGEVLSGFVSDVSRNCNHLCSLEQRQTVHAGNDHFTQPSRLELAAKPSQEAKKLRGCRHHITTYNIQH